MAQLTGRNVKTTITSLEVVADDNTKVIMVDRNDDGSVRLRLREPHENAWGSSGPSFSVTAKSARLLSLLLAGNDASYERTALEEISVSDFTAPKPEARDTEVPTPPEGDCTPLDIERAKAANLLEERENIKLQMTLDHGRDLHSSEVTGCPACENRIRPGHGDGSRSEDTNAADLDAMPF